MQLPFRMNYKSLKEFFWEALNYSIGLALLGFGVYTLVVNSFWVGYIGELTQGLVEVGYVESIDGKSTRRTYHDTIWLNLTKNKKVYTNDTIATHDSSVLEIQLENVKITLEENSLVRIRNINGKPVIRVARGRVNADVGEGSQLLVQTSLKKTELQRGKYLLTSDNPPEAETNEADGDIANGLRQAKAIPQAEAGSANTEKKDDSADAVAARPAVTPAEPSAWKLPTPSQGLVFLVQRHNTILIGYKEFCPDSCTITVWQTSSGAKVYKFKTNEQAVIEINTADLPFGQYHWQYESVHDSYSSTFEIHAYSQEKLFENLNSKRSFEILN